MKNKLKELLQRTIFPLVYNIGKIRRVSKDIIFLDAHNDKCPESLIYLRDMFVENDIKIDEQYHNFSKIGFLKSLFVSIKTVYKVSRYKVIILCDNYLAIDAFDRREETTVIQVWHGAGAYKKFGYDKEEKEISDHAKAKLFRYDIVPVSSEFSAQSFSTAMRLPIEKFKIIGVSRTDMFLDIDYNDKIKESIYHKHPSLKGKKIILWTPTFRSLEKNSTHVGLVEIEELERKLGDEYVVIKKLHPHVSINDKYSDFSSSDFMTVADIMITDYSSILFDWLFYGKETHLFVPDYEAYIKMNGFYYDPLEIPVPISKTLNELEYNLKNHNTGTDINNFIKLMLEACDGNSTERLYKLILSVIGQGVN